MKTKGTIYNLGAFGVNKTEAYIQTINESRIEFVEKGKRKVQAIHPKKELWIVDGWNKPDVITPMQDLGNGITRTKYGCFDDRYLTDFLNDIDLSKETFLYKGMEL